MVPDDDNKEDKFDFTAEGESLGYISLDQAWVQAMEHARDNTDFYGPRYAEVRLVWEVLSTEETDDYYNIQLSFRPSGRFRGEPGVDQFIIDKAGNLRIRQLLDEPTELGETGSDPASSATATFTFPRKWGSKGRANGQFNNPYGIAVDGDGNVYVAEWGNDRVQVFDSSGRFLRLLGTKGAGDGQFQGPSGVAVDGNGNVYVADTVNSRVQVFDSNGRFLRTWGSKYQFSNPYRVAVDSAGNVYVTDTTPAVQVFDVDGRLLRVLEIEVYPDEVVNGESDTDHSFFSEDPIEIAVDGVGNVYLAQWGVSQVEVFDSNGRFLRRWETNGEPNGMAVDSTDNIYLAERNHQVEVFDSNGRFLHKWGTEGDGDGQFNGPCGIAVDRAGNVYVTDGGNNRVHVFAPVLT